MEISWLESILLGLVSGFAEFLPVSAQAHRAILLSIFSAEAVHPIMELCVHIGILVALYYSSKFQLNKLHREFRMSRASARRRRRTPDFQSLRDLSLIKCASIPLVLSFLLYSKTAEYSNRIYLVSVFLLLNGLILYIPMFLPQGNKDSRSMSRLDGFLIGLGAALSIFPGISRVGVASSVAIARGADMQQAYKWSLFLSIPALIVLSCFDLYGVFITGFAGTNFTFILQCLISGCFAYLSTYFAITVMKVLTTRAGFFNFSYYSWGAALFAFILYLI